jgi:transcriptional regulator with XRE-family HTH domain
VSSTCGLSESHLSRLERGGRPPPRPSHPAYERLAELLGISTTTLRRAALRERLTIVEGIPWHKQHPVRVK